MVGRRPERSIRDKAQLATIEEKLVLKIVGSITPVDQKPLNEKLRIWLQL